MNRSGKTTRRRGLLASVLMLGVLGSGGQTAAESNQQKVPFRSWHTLRTKDVVLQKLDFSCGAASLATLATYFLGRPTTEEEALRLIRARYTAEQWKKKKEDGLSMEDLQYIARGLGLEAEGGRLGLAALLKMKGPAIIHLNKGEFQHFTVLRGIRGTTVYLADPIFGEVGMSLGMFVDQFTGAVLAVWDPAKPVASEYVLQLRKQDAIYDRIYDTVRPSFYDRVPTLGARF